MDEDTEGRARILVVEDDRNLCNTLRLILEKKGFDVETTGTGQGALEKVQERFFNVVLLDLGLPDRQGVELISPLKESHPDMDVIVITGQATLETAVRALNEGASAYTRKPLDMDDILLRVREFYEKQHLVLENRRLYRDAQQEIAERKQAEEELRESEGKYRNLVEGSIQGIVVHRNHQPLFANQAYADTFAYDSPEEITGLESLLNLVTAKDRPRNSDFGAKRMRGEAAPIHYEFEGVRKDGVLIWLDCINTVINWEGSLAILSTQVDITERKRAEEGMQESEKRLKAIMDNVPALVTLRDMEGRFLLVNSEYEKRLGVSAVDIIGQMPHTVLDKALADEVDFHVRSVIDTGEARTDEEEIRDPDQAGIILMTRFPVYDGKNNMVAVGGIGIDVTAQKKTAQALRESEERYRDLVYGSLQGILVHRNYKPLFVNDTFAEIYGYDSHTDIMFMNNFMDFIIAPQDRERIDFIGQSRMRGEYPPAQHDIQGIKKDGTIFWLESTNTLINWEGQPAILSTQIDVSERRSLEEQLRQSQKMEALGTLAGGIAHDFNNVLFPIIGFTDLLLLDAAPQSEEHEFLTTILESAHRAKDLIYQVMLFSRRGQTSKSISALGVVGREVAKLMRSTLPTTISVRAKISEGLDPVLCDPSQIHQVLLNLCVNAGQAMPDTGRLDITLENVDAEGVECLYGKTLFGRHVQIVVTDTGIGMDEETQSHMFDPFFTTKGVGEGTGLGLSTLYGIVREHDGGIFVNSSPGQGTTIEVFLPVAQEEPEDVVSPQPSIPQGSETILFVDDEVAIVTLCRNILERAGYNVLAMSDSLMALEAFREDPKRYDLVITDQSMPNMKGELLVKYVRMAKGNIPIILCTGHSATMTPESSKAIGINAFLYKPVERNQLVTVVRQVLDEAEEATDEISETNGSTMRIH